MFVRLVVRVASITVAAMYLIDFHVHIALKSSVSASCMACLVFRKYTRAVGAIVGGRVVGKWVGDGVGLYEGCCRKNVPQSMHKEHSDQQIARQLEPRLGTEWGLA